MSGETLLSDADFDLIEAGLVALREKKEKMVQFTEQGLKGHPLNDLFKIIIGTEAGAEANRMQATGHKKAIEDTVILSGKLIQIKRWQRQQRPAMPDPEAKQL